MSILRIETSRFFNGLYFINLDVLQLKKAFSNERSVVVEFGQNSNCLRVDHVPYVKTSADKYLPEFSPHFWTNAWILLLFVKRRVIILLFHKNFTLSINLVLSIFLPFYFGQAGSVHCSVNLSFIDIQIEKKLRCVVKIHQLVWHKNILKSLIL